MASASASTIPELAEQTAIGVFLNGNPFSHTEDAWKDGFAEGAAATLQPGCDSALCAEATHVLWCSIGSA